MISLRPGELALTEEALSSAELDKGSAVLDIGCGNGESIHWIKEHYGCRVAGLEPDRERLAKAIELNPQAEIYAALAEEMPFADNSFDVVLAECSVSLFADATKALMQISRVLKKKGMLIITDVYAQQPHGWQAEGLLRHIYTEQQFTDMLNRAGFIVQTSKDCGSMLKEMLIELIFEHGRDKAYQMIGLDCCAAKQIGVGYLLIAAEKNDD